MRYAVWFVRLLFAAWMIPAGLNHFIPLFPQPMGSQPLSMELIHALIDSDLFDLVKLVELVAGLGVLFGVYTPLALLVCLPVSFGVFYWDAPLEGWGSRAALFGYATLLSNSLLCLAYWRSYASMFTLRAVPLGKRELVLGGRLLFGGWMLLNGINYLWLQLWAMPAGADALAAQLMTALVNSHLLDVAMAFQALGGALLLAGILVPAALYVLMPIASCALFWALVLDQQPLNILLTLLAFAINGLLMLAHLPAYRGVLQRSALAQGESAGAGLNYDSLFISPGGAAARTAYIPALVTVLAAVWFFHYFVTGRTAQFCALVLMYPLFVLIAQRLRAQGLSPWLALAGLLPTLLAFAVLLGYLNWTVQLATALNWLAVAASAALALWGMVDKGRS